MNYLNDFLALGIIALLGAISPGPDFIIVTQNALGHGKRAGIAAALGISLGCLVHISYCVLGIGVIVTKSLLIFNLIKYLGAAYLIYLGIKGLLSKNSQRAIAANPITLSSTSLSFRTALKKGFLVNLLNPKVTLFILSIFTQVIDPSTPLHVQTLYGLEFAFIAFGWFTLLSCLLANPFLRNKLLSVQHYVEKTLGAFLILLGIKVAQLDPSL